MITQCQMLVWKHRTEHGTIRCEGLHLTDRKQACDSKGPRSREFCERPVEYESEFCREHGGVRGGARQ